MLHASNKNNYLKIKKVSISVQFYNVHKAMYVLDRSKYNVCHRKWRVPFFQLSRLIFA